MNENNGSLVRVTEFGPVFLKIVRDHLALSSKGIDPTSDGLGGVAFMRTSTDYNFHYPANKIQHRYALTEHREGLLLL